MSSGVPLILDGELEPIRDAARRGQRSTVSKLCRAIEKRGEAAGRHFDLHGPDWALLDECYDMAYCVDIALKGDRAKLEDRWLSVSMSRDGSPPEERQWLTDRLDHIWDAVQKACGREMPRPPEEPEWAREGGPVEAELVVRHPLRSRLHDPRASYTFQLLPAMLVMRGELGRVRVPRAPIAEVRWLVHQTRHSYRDRFVFYDAKGHPVGHWNLPDQGSIRKQPEVADWLRNLGWPFQVVDLTIDYTDPGDIAEDHRI